MPPIRLDHIAIARPRIAEAAKWTSLRRAGSSLRWPDSQMQLLVDVEPTAREGPRAIELASGRTLAGLEAASRRRGIRLAQPFA